MKMLHPKNFLAPTIILLFLILLLSNCNTSSKLASPHPIIGTWQEKEPDDVIQMAGSGHYIKFKADKTFQLEQQKWTDSINGGDPCGFGYTNYIKGTYKIKGNTLKLKGQHYDAGFTTLKPNCKGETTFSESYNSSYSAELTILNVDAERPSNQIKLMKQ